jgi:hypothetical protein
MNEHERQIPDELHALEALLRTSRAEADPLELDQIKQRVMARTGAPPRRVVFMKSRIATAVTALVLLTSTGGAIAFAGGVAPAGPKGGAATSQYRPGKGCGDRNHVHPSGDKKPCPKAVGQP